MSVIGIDFGYQTTLIAAPRGGGIDVLLNDYSQRKTASMVCFGDKQREIGESAKAKAVMKTTTTITNFKHLIGRRFDDPSVQDELKRCKFQTCPSDDGGISIVTKFLGETRTLTVTQILGMLLTKIKKIAEEQLKNKVSDCVVAVPIFFNDRQRCAVLTAIKIADLNCLRLFNETTAVALSYGIYKLDLPTPTEKARRVVFADLGHSSLQLSCSEFCQGKLTVLATAYDLGVGGRSFDEVLLDKFCDEILAKYKKDVRKDPKALGKLELECEKLKQTMSSISTSVPLNIECLIDEIDVSGRVDRAEFELLSAGIFARIEDCCKNLIDQMKRLKVSVADVDAIEIVGGASRIPSVKKLFSTIFGKELSTTLNLDEATARGAALEAAIVSPVFRVRNFETKDKTPYAISLHWQAVAETGESSAELFDANGDSQMAKVLNFWRSGDFDLLATYADPSKVVGNESSIGTFSINGAKPEYDGAAPKIKVKLRLDDNGCLRLEEASMLLKPAPEPEVASPSISPDSATGTEASTAMDTTPDAAGATASDATVPEPAKPEPAAKTAKAEEPAAKKPKLNKTVALQIVEQKVYVPTAQQLLALVEAEGQMASNDKKETEKANAKNALEEYMYSIRDAVAGDLADYIPADVRESFSSKLATFEEWLYEEGDDCSKSEYNAKLSELQEIGSPAQYRFEEAAKRPLAADAFQKSVVMIRKFVDQCRAGDDQYSHIDAKDVDKVAADLEKKEKNFNEKMAAQNAQSLSLTPVWTAADINRERESLEKVSSPIMNKSKPKVVPPTPAPTSTTSPAPAASSTTDAPPASPPSSDDDTLPSLSSSSSAPPPSSSQQDLPTSFPTSDSPTGEDVD